MTFLPAVVRTGKPVQYLNHCQTHIGATHWSREPVYFSSS